MKKYLIYSALIALLVLFLPKFAHAYQCFATATPTPCPAGSGTNFSSVVGSVNLNDVSTVSSSEVWVVGASCKVAKFDGSAWVNHSASITGCGGATLNGVSASSSTNVWIGGNSGVVWKYSGSWTSHTPSGTRWTTTNINDVSAFTDSGTSKVWIVGNSGNVWHYDNSSWGQDVGTGKWGINNMNGVSYLSATETWIAGDGGQVWKYNGSTWTQHDGTGKWGTHNVKSITAYTSTSVFLVTDDGQVWEYDGSNWSQHDGTNRWGATQLNDISDKYSTEVWTVGNSGKVFELNAPRFSANSTPATVTVNGVVYTKSFYVQNVCRDDTTRSITAVTDTSGTAETCVSGAPSGDSWDPSTLKVTTTVSWAGGNSITTSEYITRWKNAVCTQTQWTNNGVTLTRTCPTTDYSAKTNTTAAASLSLPTVLGLVTVPTGDLTSTTLDTTDMGESGNTGPSYNSIFWQGTLAANTAVKFQLAASDCPGGQTNAPTCSSGAWSYVGGTQCDSSNWFNPGATDTIVEVKCPTQLNNKRFLKYKVMLCTRTTCSALDVLGNTPTVNDIIINWSP